MPSWYVARTAQMYAKDESSYGTAPTFAATDAVRHLAGSRLKFNPKNFRPSPQRNTHPSQMALLASRQTAEWALKAQMYPSGTLNTLPELNALLKNGFGAAAQNITLATTFSGTPTTTTGTIGSATGLVAGQMIRIDIASGANAGSYMRRVVTASTSLVWAPALPSAPASGDAVKGCVTYTPATALAASMDIAHYPQAPAASTPARELLGCVVDKLSFMFDSNLEPMVQFSGPAKAFASAAQSQPGGFTTVGAESAIPSGISGYFYYGGTLYQVEKVQIDINNNMDVQNTALGTSSASAYFRKGKRDVQVKVSAKVSDDLTMYTPSLNGSSNELFLQIGITPQQIWGMSLRGVVLTDHPEIPDGSDETQNWDFVGTALGTSGNDEVTLGMC